jgi:hypothetical protein
MAITVSHLSNSPRTSAVLNRRPDIPHTYFVDHRVYDNPEVFRVETETIFTKIWKFVCHIFVYWHHLAGRRPQDFQRPFPYAGGASNRRQGRLLAPAPGCVGSRYAIRAGRSFACRRRGIGVERLDSRARPIGRPPLSGPVWMLVHDRPGCHRDDGFRNWWAVAQSAMRPLGVVVFPPFFDDDLRLF